MIGVFHTILINGVEVYRPSGFSPTREHIYAAEITTCTGKTCADLIGWKYADMDLEWDTLPQTMLNTILNMTGECSLSWIDADGVSHTETVIPTTKVYAATRHTGKDGNPLWRDIKVGVKFLNAHN